jgi:hypothetical protein
MNGSGTDMFDMFFEMKCFFAYFCFYFRAYIISVSPANEFNVFYIDYGTTATVKQSDTRLADIDGLWLAPPLAVPFIVKGIRKKIA